MLLCEEPTSTTATQLGGKAKNLALLRDAGFAVPPFLVSPADVPLAVAELGLPLAVRSSVSVEDGRQASFAGQFRSYLNLQSVEDVEPAIAACLDSVSAPGVREYALRHGIDPAALKMHVIVQKMVEPVVAGVAFTVNPTTGEETVAIEAVAGLADELLAGRQKPLPQDHPLLRRHRPAIERTALALQQFFGAPQDVEFAVEGDEVFILQSRPITRIHFAAEAGEWTNADFRDGGVSSTVCTPLMWSLYELAWNTSLKGTLRKLKLFDRDFEAGRQFFGRPYWNLGEVKRCVAKLPGFVERRFDDDLSVEVGYEGDGYCTPFTLGNLVRAIPRLWAARRFLHRQQETAERFLELGFWQIAQRYESPPTDPEGRFGELIQRDFLHTECCYFRTIFATSLAKLDFLAAFPEAHDRRLLAALPPLAHMAPVRAVQLLADRRHDRLAAIVHEHRHHTCAGIDVARPRWDEEQEFVVALLREMPEPSGTDPREAFEDAYAATLACLPRRRRRAFCRKLQRLRHFLWLREELRDLSSRMYYIIRQYALAIAADRRLGDDIFFMTYHAILDDDRQHIRRHRDIYESYRNFQAPNEIGRRWRPRKPLTPNVSPCHILRGLGASAGTASGRAFIASDVRTAAAMPRGNILVCPFTDPGWTPVLDRAAAVVTETGGLLSHAAVLCRELGVPAVLGVPGAVARITPGQTVTVHGAEGLVHLDPL
jgi:pyruvate,water dikinase